tara:strand:- start:781 stop:1080 length:300 start_codon:yes stop_codon:yes gene_type:complete
MIHLADVLHKFYPNTEWGLDGNSYAGLHWSKNNKIDKPTEEAIQAKLKELENEYEKQAYARSRADAYPSWQTQLDQLFHQGYDGWKAEVQKVKDQFPKP